jgi:hypothetical protein
MRRIGLGVLVVLFTLTAGICSALVWRHFRSQPLIPADGSTRASRSYIRGNHYDAAHGSLWEFSSSDGREFKRWTITCGSPEGARQKMKELLEKSAQIVLREPVNGAQGQQLGEEVVAVFPSDDRENGIASLFYVSQSEYLVQITSTSLVNILDFRADSKHEF